MTKNRKLEDCFREPVGFVWDSFKNAKGADIRTGHVAPEGEVKGTVVILTGFRESIEKYFEVANDMLERGYAVWMMDWRGQGGSERYLKSGPQKAHHQGYDEQIADLDQFAKIVAAQAQKPLLLMAHSMGAHISLRYMKECDCVFDAALLTAPMFDIVTQGFPRPLARQMAKFAKAGNYLEKYVPGGSDWSEEKDRAKSDVKTSDPKRFEISLRQQLQNPALQIGDPTYGWIYHTFQSIDVLNQEDYLKSIKIPVLMQVSGEDKVVSIAAQERACRLLPDCKRVDIPGAKHEIWMERDALRDVWLQQVDVFLGEQQRAAALRLKKPDQHKKPRPPAPG